MNQPTLKYLKKKYHLYFINVNILNKFNVYYNGLMAANIKFFPPERIKTTNPTLGLIPVELTSNSGGFRGRSWKLTKGV